MPCIILDRVLFYRANQTSIIQTYHDDFRKYASKAKQRYLQKVFQTVPKLVTRKFKYSKIDNDIQSRDLKVALELLEKAGIVRRVLKTSGLGVPLNAYEDERHFKVIFLDVGLLQNLLGVTADIMQAKDVLKVNEGAIAEQFVGQELLAYQDPYQTPTLHYWVRESKSSSAEVDYLVSYESRIFPIEVKAGKTGTLRSMHLFLSHYKIPVGFKVAQQPFTQNHSITTVPLYAMESLPWIACTPFKPIPARLPATSFNQF